MPDNQSERERLEDEGLTDHDKKELKKFREEFGKRASDLKNGPIANRVMTDKFCCLIFFAFLIGMVVVFYYGLTKGQPSLITVGWDADGHGCGNSADYSTFPVKEPSQTYGDTTHDMMKYANNDAVNLPHLYFPVPPKWEEFEAAQADASKMAEVIKTMLARGVCVSKCPEDAQVAIAGVTGYTAEETAPQCLITQNMRDDERCDASKCQCNLIEGTVSTGEGEATEVSTPFRMSTVHWGNEKSGFCLPIAQEDPAKQTDIDKIIIQMRNQITQSKSAKSAKGSISQWFSDIGTAWWVLLLSSVTSVVLGYLYLWVVRLVGRYIIWGTYILTLIAFIVGGAALFYYQKTRYHDASPAPTISKNTADTALYTSYGLFGVAVIWLLLLCCCMNAIKIGIAVFETTSKYVQSNMHILVIPIISYIVTLVWFLFWLWGAVYVFAAGYPEPRLEDNLPFVSIMRWDQTTEIAIWYDVFGLFWINAFVIGTAQFIIGASACLWYFEVSTDTGGQYTVRRALWWAFRFHLGSVAFGSAIIAICQILRILFEYYRQQIRKADQTAFVKVMLCLTGWILWLLENCAKYISKNAYIQIALTNDNFCPAAWNALALIMKNAHRFGFASNIGSIFIFFGGMAIVSVNGIIAYFVLTGEHFAAKLDSPIAPLVVVIIITCTIAYGFLSIYSFASDAILQSFLLDEELRFQGNSRPEEMQDFADALKNRGKGCCS